MIANIKIKAMPLNQLARQRVKTGYEKQISTIAFKKQI